MRVMETCEAVTHVENVLLRYERTLDPDGDVPKDLSVKVMLWAVESIRVSEVSWTWTPDIGIWAGASLMQSDLPWGFASCVAIERWILGLVMGDPETVRDARGTYRFLCVEGQRSLEGKS